ncbi:bifunctional proline dehydrogenase/L-glutamate gamma-semialdehyde dehydrogenase [Limnoglobus roseus]|uniref:L-glutamate gamma-semialdehyde dehydrogenase n=1 Tax=Limnoglobus roseus TaxID=2598579 RepID=A0A5C1AK47_9BACT|nr:bifunctional proline dehydrogenase/L-glutamate gamma-semialdehyde dehydrogenase [Limnoglobus roseus]QEL19769.1 1-pyrroline-5-carboxylate dehydrogenase [Limnoglobus roseus]
MNTTLTPRSEIARPATPIDTAVVRRAAALLDQAARTQTRPERAEGERLARMMDDAPGKAFTLAMVDEVFRSHRPRVQGRRYRGLLGDFGTPRYLSAFDRTLMRAGGAASLVGPSVVMPLIERRLRQDSSRVILDAEPAALDAYLGRRSADGFRINLNHLGEAVLGEHEAEHRMAAVLGHLGNPRVTYISVKISAIFSQINVVAWDATLAAIKDRLRRLYRAALPEKKFVNLDMEEYRDLELTLAAFRDVLDEPEFRDLPAGVVLQAYLPDSWASQQELTEWAKRRVENGGAAIKVRLVKGANLAMEAVEAELHGWNPAPYPTKADTDANYRRMMEYGCRPENAAAVRLGVASHNLFDVALALELRERFGTADRVELEMLEGMANHQARAVRDAAGGLLLYAPAVGRDDFLSAMAYLVRRLDENTSPENFLRVAFGLKPGSPAWALEQERFERGWAERLTVSAESRRAKPAVDPDAAAAFENEPDTDWTQARSRAALNAAIADWKPLPVAPLPTVEELLGTAAAAQPAWEAAGIEHRAKVLHAVARVMTADRFGTIATMRADARKSATEADPEVSEAIDFARYYADTFRVPAGVQANALGVVVVASPWNFPYAIPAGGVLAALAAGNAVVLKPAPETVQTAARLAQQLWDAGVPRDVFQFFPCPDGDVGKALLTDPRVGAIVLTGAWDTAKLFHSWRPRLRLYAETSGKNAMVITAQADRELAIKDLVKSAFGHAGQKCSAASLAILEAEVYDDPAFRRQLLDAAASLPVGPSTDPRSVITPVVKAPEGALKHALTTLDAGEEWLLEPKQVGDDPCLWSPGIKLGVRPGSAFHRAECFGPVLGLMRAASLAGAIDWQNAVDFGLTAGLHSLDPAEQAVWRDRVQAGNLYVNRPTTGAIVNRQPFGGWKKSSVGPGAKAGGPNYTFLFTRLSDSRETTPGEVEASYRAAWREHFAVEHDPSGLRSEANVFRYRPCRGVVLRLAVRDEATVARAKLAAEITGVPLTVSVATEETDAVFAARLSELAKGVEFLRIVAPLTDDVLRAVHASGLNLIDAPVTAVGRAELRFWVREQAVSTTRHRYGQIPAWVPPSRR